LFENSCTDSASGEKNAVEIEQTTTGWSNTLDCSVTRFRMNGAKADTSITAHAMVLERSKSSSNNSFYDAVSKEKVKESFAE
jgi:hypothetical protein